MIWDEPDWADYILGFCFVCVALVILLPKKQGWLIMGNISAIQNSTNPIAMDLEVPSKIQPLNFQERNQNMKKIAGIALLAIAIILFVGALAATCGAAAGVLPIGMVIMQSFISAAPPLLLASLYLLQEGPAKVELSAGNIKYTMEGCK